MWQVTRDRWHVTRDTWHVTRDTWHMTHSLGWTFSQNFSSLALPVWDWQCIEDIWTKGWHNKLMNQLISDEAVYRTAPATPALEIQVKLAWQSGLIWHGNLGQCSQWRQGETYCLPNPSLILHISVNWAPPNISWWIFFSYLKILCFY